jgi:RAD50-interacting protein 1
MAHTIDELFVFDKQLKMYFNYPNDEYNCLHILCDDKIFSHWTQLEHRICISKIDTMFSNGQKDEIWSCKCDDIDEYKIPNCTESFILLMKSIAERYKQLPYASKKLRLLKLQLELFNDYRLRLCLFIRDDNVSKDPLNKINLGILNATNYILYVLGEWENTHFYIELQFIKSSYLKYLNNYESESLKSNLFKFDDSNKLEELLDLKLSAESYKKFDTQIKNFSDLHMDLNNYIDLNTSVFDVVTQQFESINNEMIKKIVSECLWQITSRSRNYRKEKWMSLPSFKSFYKPNLSQSATEMFISLKNLLNSLQESLAKNLFLNILKRITRKLDKFFYKEIILSNQFNDGGISQLEFDVKRYLLPILNEFSSNFSIENYFINTKEALVLLNLNEGSSLLLRETLNKGLHKSSNEHDQNMNTYNAKNALKEFGIKQLTLEDAELVLSLRIFKPN